MGGSGSIKAGRVLAAPGEEAPRGPSRLSFSDGRITAIEPVPPESLTPAEAATLLMPALADAHDHGVGFRDLAWGVEPGPMEIWVQALMQLPRVDLYLSAACAFAYAARGGVCAVNYCYSPGPNATLLEEVEAVSRAARDVGVHVAFGIPFFERNYFVYGDVERWLAGADAEMREMTQARYAGVRPAAERLALMREATRFEHDRFRLHYHPVAPQWVGDGTMRAIAEASAADGRRVHMHLLETQRQREWADAHHPGGLLRHLDTLGILTDRLTVAHGIWLRPEEQALLAERGVTVSINISSNLKLRSGLPPIGSLLRAGVPLAIGMDAHSFDDEEDMLRELRLFWHASPQAAGAPPPLGLADAFAAAARNGRRTIVPDGGGTLVPGAPADLIAIDYGALSSDCVRDDLAVEHVLLGRAAARHLRALIVGGRNIIENGRCLTVDLPELEDRLLAAARAAYRDAPPDPARIARFQAAVGAFYARGDHCCG